MTTELTAAQVEALAPASGAVHDARALLREGRLTKLARTEDSTLFWADVKGSAKAPYSASVDLAAGVEHAVARCTCPSRQRPCKHALALMLAFAGGAKFAVAAAPADLAAKRAKASAKATTAKTAREPAARDERSEEAKKAAATKKAKLQAAALETLEKFLVDLVHAGLGSLTATTVKSVEEQARRMNDADLRGAHALLRQLVDAATQGKAPAKGKGKKPAKKAKSAGPNDEPGDTKEQLAERHARLANVVSRLWVALRKGRKMLEGKGDEEGSASEADAELESLLGRAWRLPELKERGYWVADRVFVELAHEEFEDRVLEQVTHRGFLLDLADGSVHTEATTLPFAARKQASGSLRKSRHGVLSVREAALYPGTVVNRRVRWGDEEGTLAERPCEPRDLEAVRSHARAVSAAVELFRGQLKNPLAPHECVTLVDVKKIGRVGESVAVEDAAGARLVLRDAPGTYSTMENALHAAGAFGAGPMALRLWFSPRERLVYAQPLALFAGDKHLRLGL